MALSVGTRLTRVATDALGGTEPSDEASPRRFSPVRYSGGRILPVLYAGQDLACALGETVFHDLDDDAAVPQEVLRADLLTSRAATLVLHRELILADLRDAALAGYGTKREAVTATPPTGYPVTREWAQLAWDAGGFEGWCGTAAGAPTGCPASCSCRPSDRVAYGVAVTWTLLARRCRCSTARDSVQ